MSSGSDASSYEEHIPKIETMLIHTKNEVIVHIEHFFDIQNLEGMGLYLNETMICYCIWEFYNDIYTIHPKLIRIF